MILLNHREIEYYADKRWKTKELSIDNLKDIFSEWPDDKQKNAAINIMEWLNARGEALFDEDLIMDYGTDCLRIYLMFEKEPKENDKYYDSWEECNLEGAYKFIGKYRRLILTALQANENGFYSNINVAKLIKKVDLLKVESLSHIAKGNTMPNRHNAISCIMEGINVIHKELNIGQYVVQFHSHEIEEAVPASDKVKNIEVDVKQGINPDINKLCRELIILVSPFAPFISEDLIQYIDNDLCILESKYLLTESEIEKKLIIPVQINGKTKKVLEFLEGADDVEILERAKNEMSEYLKQGTYKTVYVKEKIINYVVKKIDY